MVQIVDVRGSGNDITIFGRALTLPSDSSSLVANIGSIRYNNSTGMLEVYKLAGWIAEIGPIGPTGAVGATGVVGPIGPTGATGPIGLTGATGPIGLTGVIGPIGLTGVTGPIGLIGATGPIGVGTSGPIGMIGPSGPIGLTGPTGATGAVGPIGLTGPTGAAALLAFTPVQQGGGVGQATNKVYIGWSGSGLKAQVDNTDEGVFGMLPATQTWTGTNSFNGVLYANAGVASAWITATTINASGAIASAAGLSGVSLNTYSGNIQANGARVRSNYGARGSGDSWACVTLSDYSLYGAQSGYNIFPNGLIIQWIVANLPIQQTTTLSFPITFPSYAAAVTGNLGYYINLGDSPVIGCQALSNSQFAASLAGDYGGSEACWFIAIGW
jgi:hypothetical protein